MHSVFVHLLITKFSCLSIKNWTHCTSNQFLLSCLCSVICGLTEETNPKHIVKAALEAITFQTRDILEAMALDCGFSQSKLLVDGGMTANDYLMQIQADYCGIPVGMLIPKL